MAWKADSLIVPSPSSPFTDILLYPSDDLLTPIKTANLPTTAWAWLWGPSRGTHLVGLTGTEANPPRPKKRRSQKRGRRPLAKQRMTRWTTCWWFQRTTFSFIILHIFRLNCLHCWLNMLLVYLQPCLGCHSSFVSGRNQPTKITFREEGRAIMFCVCLPEQSRCPGERSKKVWRDSIWQRPCGSSGERYYISESKR